MKITLVLFVIPLDKSSINFSLVETGNPIGCSITLTPTFLLHFSHAWEKWSKKVGVKVIEQPIGLPVSTKEKLIEDLSKGITKRTKVIFISHISSATALEFPVKDICDLAKSKKIMTIVDGHRQ